MSLEHAFSCICEVETFILSRNQSWPSVNFWPLMRQCLWLELTQNHYSDKKRHLSRRPACHKRIVNRIISKAQLFLSRPPSLGSETIAFISRPVYLQAMPNGTYFDRIVDPLLFCLPEKSARAKYYVAPLSAGVRLNYKASFLRPSPLIPLEIPESHRTLLAFVSEKAGVSSKDLILRYTQSLNAFYCWLQTARRFIDSRTNLKAIYLTSWYFPDMMAIIVAARERGIKTIDVQHGKQGKIQAMYSGWRIPGGGYEMLPDIFWNWGTPSADHILATSSDRVNHRPIVGGFPWLDYYRKHVFGNSVLDRKRASKHVLVTLQSPQGKNKQPIPDFLLDFLCENPPEVFFVFRCHPNDKNGVEYCRQRLSGLSSELYEIDDGSGNLYDALLIATHHVTAYSSCCYEASAFGVPTLLFGEDARTIYGEEIANGFFTWTIGDPIDLASWLSRLRSNEGLRDGQYIISSLEHAAAILRRSESMEFDYYLAASRDPGLL